MELLRFFAGDVELAVAAKVTRKLDGDDGAIVHVCELLSLPVAERSSLVLRVEHEGRGVAFRVDEPVRFSPLSADEAVSTSAKGLLAPYVIGFANFEEGLVTLVRLGALVELATEFESPTEGRVES